MAIRISESTPVIYGLIYTRGCRQKKSQLSLDISQENCAKLVLLKKAFTTGGEI